MATGAAAQVTHPWPFSRMRFRKPGQPRLQILQTLDTLVVWRRRGEPAQQAGRLSNAAVDRQRRARWPLRPARPACRRRPCGRSAPIAAPLRISTGASATARARPSRTPDCRRDAPACARSPRPAKPFGLSHDRLHRFARRRAVAAVGASSREWPAARGGRGSPAIFTVPTAHWQIGGRFLVGEAAGAHQHEGLALFRRQHRQPQPQFVEGDGRRPGRRPPSGCARRLPDRAGSGARTAACPSRTDCAGS